MCVEAGLSLAAMSGCDVLPLVREPLTAEAARGLAGQLKALSDPMRLRLLSVVASHTGGEACVCDLSVGIELSQPTISHHLKVLRTAVCWTVNAGVPGCITGSFPRRCNNFRSCWVPTPL